jgi:DNA-directed RNA polymerase specialized sigma subunit
MNNYKRVEKWLYNLDALKERVKNLKLQYAELESRAEGGSMDYSKDKLSATYAFNSTTENIAIDMATIKSEITKLGNRIIMLESSMNMLNDTERTVITGKYFANQPWWSIAGTVKYSERHCRNYRRTAIEKLSIALFGE